MNTILIILLLISIAADGYIALQLMKDDKPKSIGNKYDHCDIGLLSDGTFAPTYRGQYIYIISSEPDDIAKVWDTVIKDYNCFSTKQEAKQYLDKWLDLRAKRITFVGL